MGLRSDLRARAIELAKDGLRPGAIAACVGLPHRSVKNLIAHCRRQGMEFPRHRKAMRVDGTPVRIAIREQEHLDALDAAAARRGLSRHQMASRLLNLLLADGLINSICDDGVADA